jgi:hypothetical protein
MVRSNFSGAWGHNLQLEVFSAWNSPNIEGNFSTVNVQVRLIANGYAALWGATDRLLSLNVGGIREDARVDMSISQGQVKALWAKDYRVNHNPDGTKSITISATLHADISNYGSATASFDLPLSNIPRASTGSPANGVIGQPIALNISRHSDSFKHAIWVRFGNYDKKIAGDNVDTSFTWTPEMSMINEIPNAGSSYGTLTYITYNNGREIGRDTQPITLSVPDNIKPTLTGFTLTDTNTAAASVVPGEQAFIQILSNIKVNFGQATGAYGSTITGYYAEIVGKNQSTTTQGGTLGIMNYIGNVTIRARVTDSRGRTSNTIERTVNILEYFAPILNFDIVRSGAQSSTLTITRNAKVAPLTVGSVQKNQMKLTFKVAQFGSDDYKVDTGSASGTWTTVSSLVNSNANLQGEYAANSSWTVLGILEDKFTRTEFAVNVATESVVMSYGKDRIGFGKIAEFPNVTDSAWEYYFSGKPIQNRQLTNSDGRNLANVYKTPDDYVTTGFYYSDSSLLPDRSGGYLLVESYNTDFVKQTYTPWDKAYTFTRLKIGKNKPWTAWISPALEQCYPIGSIYQSTEPTNPATFMGGVWERFGNGRVLVGVDETDADFNAANKQGGEKTVSGISISSKGYGLANIGSFESRILLARVNTSSDEVPLNPSNLQPYITIYRWRRIA